MARSGTGADRWARSLAPLGSAAAFSWPVLLAYCPLGILIQAPGNISIYGGPAGLWFLASAIGMASLAAVLAVARSASRRRGGPGAVAVLACYALAGVAQSVTFGLASALLGAADSPHLGFRLSGLFLHVPLLAAVGYAVARHDAHMRIRSDLGATRARLLSMGRSVEEALDRVEVDLGSAVRQSLEPAVESLDAALAAAAAGIERSEVLSEIDSLVEEQVRPLAHGLVDESDAEVEALDALIERAERPRSRVPLPDRFRLGASIAPGLIGLVTAIAAVATAARELAPGQVLVYLPAVSLITWALFALTKRVVGSVEIRTVVGAPVIVCLHAAVGSAAFWLTGALGMARPGGIAASWAVGFALLGSASVASYLVQARRDRSETELQAETVQLESALALVRRRERLVRRRLAFVVHGSLQGALHAAAMRIGESQGLTDRLGDEIRRDLGAALSQLEPVSGSAAVARTVDAIDELSSVWGGHRRFDARLDVPIEARLSGDGDADEAVAEVVREAVNNAFRHGAAAGVEVHLKVGEAAGESAHGPDHVAISVTDDGTGHSGGARRGLGSAMFDDLCSDWELRSEGGRTAFRAQVALAARSHAAAGPGVAAGGAGDPTSEL